ncbi:hypothetical protein ACTSKR_12425 [Chitinibacteraceae bacterium HSL-7]
MRRGIWLAVLVLCQPVWADRTDVVTLQHRLANEMVPLLQDAFPQSRISALRQQLVVTSPDDAAFDALLGVVHRLDTPQQMLRIDVEQHRGYRRSGAGISVDRIEIGPDGSAANVRLFGQSGSGSTQTAQSVRVMDGGRASITLGQARFYPDIGFVYRPGYRIERYGQWVTTGTGFWAEPHVIGNDVQLRLYPQDSRFSPDGAIDYSGTYSEVRGQLGEWLPVGASQRQSQAGATGMTTGSTQAQDSYTVWVRIVPSARH